MAGSWRSIRRTREARQDARPHDRSGPWQTGRSRTPAHRREEGKSTTDRVERGGHQRERDRKRERSRSQSRGRPDQDRSRGRDEEIPDRGRSRSRDRAPPESNRRASTGRRGSSTPERTHHLADRADIDQFWKDLHSMAKAREYATSDDVFRRYTTAYPEVVAAALEVLTAGAKGCRWCGELGEHTTESCVRGRERRHLLTGSLHEGGNGGGSGFLSAIQMVLWQLRRRGGGRTQRITTDVLRRATRPRSDRVASVDAASVGTETTTAQQRTGRGDGSGPRNVRCRVCGTEHATSSAGCISDLRKKAFAAKAVTDWSASRECYTCGAIGHPMMDHPDHPQHRPNFEYPPWVPPTDRGRGGFRGGFGDRGRGGYGSGFRGGGRGGFGFRGGRGGPGFGGESQNFGRGGR